MDLQNALEILRAFFKENDRLPSLSEAAELFRYSSRNAAVYLIKKLIDSGYLLKDLKGKLITTPLFHKRLKVLGSVAAGLPTEEQEIERDTVSLDEFLVKNLSSTYMLEVKGDSMLHAGLYPGDFVIVEKGDSPKLGDIVIAQIDDEWTMKYYRKKEGNICLEAANPKYSDIYPTRELNVAGVVVASCRKYK
jgi:SOS regulatory protein LexA